MKISGKYVEEHQCKFETSAVECLKALIRECGVPSHVFEREGEFMVSKDISYHGSPCYEYTTCDVEDDLVPLLRTLLQAKKDMISIGMACPFDFD